MTEFFYRTEDIKPDEVAKYFVETKRDREIINALKARNPVVLSGSRGVGKSFLLRKAEGEMLEDWAEDRVLPVYVTFIRGTLINTTGAQQFQHWMLARICAKLLRTLHGLGLISTQMRAMQTLAGGTQLPAPDAQTAVEGLIARFEESWKAAPITIDASVLPTIDHFQETVEDLCSELSIARIVVLIDEAAHILIPEQQRQFFTLFRDLRSPFLTCKAAVYPGVTSYGDTFQPLHDATMISLDRDVLGPDYLSNMREIVEKQADSSILESIVRNGQNFSVLSYACSGNPRVLLKTLARTPQVSTAQSNATIREYYVNDLWSEHSTLPDKYVGHKHLIDWGRRFIEDTVIPDLRKKNDQYLGQGQSTCFFWIHRDAPQPVKESLKLLAYSGIVTEHATGIKATRSEVGTRYLVNLGALIAKEANPVTTGFPIAKNLDPRRMIEFGANHAAYQSLLAALPNFVEPAGGAVLRSQLAKPLTVLDISEWQRSKLREINLTTVGDVLEASESKLQSLHYVGEKRSRRIRNAAIAAVLEYLSG